MTGPATGAGTAASAAAGADAPPRGASGHLAGQPAGPAAGPAASSAAGGAGEPYDALLLLGFGGPEQPDDVVPFLANVTRGRGIPTERLAEVGSHYQLFGGRSPINDQNRALLAALRPALAPLPVYWGNRNWTPLLTDTVATMAADGVRRALVWVTSLTGSYSGCRQYQEDLAAARAAVGPGAPQLFRLRHAYAHPLVIAAQAAAVGAALDQVGPQARLVFTAHSIPVAAAQSSPYVTQLRAAAALVSDAVGHTAFDLVFQSRSGPPQVPWLEPDISEHLTALAAGGTTAVVVVPIGFVSDHIEVLYDLDTVARADAERLGLRWARAATVGSDPRLVDTIVELVAERQHGTARRWLGDRGPSHDRCPLACCPPPAARPQPAGRP